MFCGVFQTRLGWAIYRNLGVFFFFSFSDVLASFTMGDQQFAVLISIRAWRTDESLTFSERPIVSSFSFPFPHPDSHLGQGLALWESGRYWL